MEKINFADIEKHVFEKFKETMGTHFDGTEKKLAESIALIASRVATMAVAEYHKKLNCEQ